ncbi:hypothetical protein Tco_0952310 [Tanacetum coccineum]|uniref:Uncharacterized protein n=1 Tax=Tanacetum coccineum TaxID=301880 RepID=A0ABQ5DWL6_9ASTR
MKNTSYPHQRYAVCNTLVNEEEQTGFTQYAVSIKEDTAYPCLHSPKTTEDKAQYAVSRETQYAVFKIWNEYNILEDIKRGPYSKKSLIRRIQLLGYASSRRHFKTLNLDELRLPDFNLLSDQEYSEEEEAEAMAETMEQYMSKTRTDYGLRVARPKIEEKDSFELKGQFLKEL